MSQQEKNSQQKLPETLLIRHRADRENHVNPCSRKLVPDVSTAYIHVGVCGKYIFYELPGAGS